MRRHVMLALTTLSLFLPRPNAAEPVELAVHFKLTDLDYRPLPLIPVRLVIGKPPRWQNANAGTAFSTDAVGEHQFSAHALIEQRWRKMPNNFVDSLLSRPQPTDYLHLAAELTYAGRRRLYVVELHRFSDGTVLQDNFSIYTPDARGDFTPHARFTGQAWQMADLGGALLTTPGHDIANATLEPDGNDPMGKRWILTLAFKRAPAPVTR